MDITSAFREKLLGSPGSKSYDVPAFDEAFQEDNLKKFYQEQDSASHVSSPGKDNGMAEEFVPTAGASQDLLQSPIGRLLRRMSEEQNMNGPILDVELDPTFENEIGGIKNDDYERAQQNRNQRIMIESQSYGRPMEKAMMPDMGENAQRMLYSQGLTIQKAMSLPANPHQYFANIQNQVQNRQPKPSLEDLIKNKQVFKIEKNVRSPSIQQTPPQSKLNPFTLQSNQMHQQNNAMQQKLLQNGISHGQMLNYQANLMNQGPNQMLANGNPTIMDYLNMRGKRPEDMMPEIRNFLHPHQQQQQQQQQGNLY